MAEQKKQEKHRYSIVRKLYYSMRGAFLHYRSIYIEYDQSEVIARFAKT
jgi:hypothetical protein